MPDDPQTSSSPCGLMADGHNPRDWIEAAEAVRRLANVMKSAPSAKDLLLGELASGRLSANATIVRREWDVGKVHADPIRNGVYIIGSISDPTHGRVSLDRSRFSRKPRGARRYVIWQKSIFSWIAPPGRLTRKPKNGLLRRDVTDRIVMLGVAFSRREFDVLINNQRKREKASYVAKANGITRKYNDRAAWRRRLPRLYALADNAKFNDEFNGYLEKDGTTKKSYALLLKAEAKDIGVDKKRLRTYLRQIEYLLDLDRLALIKMNDVAD